MGKHLLVRYERDDSLAPAGGSVGPGRERLPGADQVCPEVPTSFGGSSSGGLPDNRVFDLTGRVGRARPALAGCIGGADEALDTSEDAPRAFWEVVHPLGRIEPLEALAKDGTGLRGHVYIPNGEGPFATILSSRRTGTRAAPARAMREERRWTAAGRCVATSSPSWTPGTRSPW